MKRITVHFSGSVQGVGFRYTTCTVAEGLPVAGYVKNLPDGRVQMVAEGDAADLDKLIVGIKRAMSGYINETQISESQPSGEFKSFRVTY